MAQLYVNTVTSTTFKWSVQGLGSAFTSSNYSSVGISTSYFTSGTTTRPNVLTYTQDYTGTTSTNSITFSHGLSAGTYTLYGFASSGGKYYSCGSVTITVPSSDTTAPSLSNIVVDIPSHGYINTTTFTASVVVTDNIGVSSVVCNFNGTNYSYGSKSGSTYYFRIDTPITGATRTIKFTAYDSASNSKTISTSIWTCYDGTSPAISYVEAIESNGGIRVGLTASDDLSGIDEVIYKISSASNSQPSDSSFGNAVYKSPTDNSYTYTTDANYNPLEAGKKYWIQFTVKDRAGNYSAKKYASCTVSVPRPGNWSWTQAELNAFNGVVGYSISTVTYERWNSFVNRIADFAKWKIGNSYTEYDLGNALMTSSDKKLTASRFNKVKYAIGSMSPTGSGISDVKSGDPVYGWYFIQLRDKLNSIV